MLTESHSNVIKRLVKFVFLAIDERKNSYQAKVTCDLYTLTLDLQHMTLMLYYMVECIIVLMFLFVQ